MKQKLGLKRLFSLVLDQLTHFLFSFGSEVKLKILEKSGMGDDFFRSNEESEDLNRCLMKRVHPTKKSFSCGLGLW